MAFIQKANLICVAPEISRTETNWPPVRLGQARYFYVFPSDGLNKPVVFANNRLQSDTSRVFKPHGLISALMPSIQKA